MNKLNKENRKSPGFWADLIKKFRLAWFLIQDYRVPITTKFIPIIIILYVFSPIDFLPDVLPIIGQIDDLALIILGLELFISISPRTIVQNYMKKFL